MHLLLTWKRFLLRRIVVLILFLVFISKMVYSQEGGVMLTHFAESRQTEDQNWAICQDSRNIMLFANRRGVVTFDGYNWNIIRLPVIPYSMVFNSNDERVYIGGENGYGYLFRNENGIYEYTAIETDSLFNGIVTDITITDSMLYVITSGCLAIHRLPDLDQISFYSSEPGEQFASLFDTPWSEVFLSIWSKGLCRLTNSGPELLITGYMTAWDDILFVLPHDDTRVLIGLASNSMHLFDGLEFYNWVPDDEGYLDQKLFAGGHIINDTLYLFSTIEGGVVVACRHSRKVYHTINYETGLPDNEVFAVGSDDNGGLWISHEFGLTRADLTLPVRNFSIYQGLRGNLVSSLWYNEQLYAATSDGLFLLREVKKYETEEVLRRVKVSQSGHSEADKSDSQEPELEIKQQLQSEILPERRTIFDRIFGKRAQKEIPELPIEQVNKPIGQEQSVRDNVVPRYRYVTRSVSRLSSVGHEFRRISGIDEKCKQLVATPYGILAGTNRGLYYIKDSLAIPLVTGRYINRIGSRTDEGRYFVATDNGYFSIIYEDDEWRASIPFPPANRSFYSVAVDSTGNLWFGAENSLVLLENTDKDDLKSVEYSVDSPFMQRYHVEYIRDTVFVFTETGIYYFNKESDSLLSLYGETGVAGNLYKYIFTENGEPWVFRNGFPSYFGSGADWTDNDQSMLRIFDGLVSISSTEGTLWLTDNANRIIRMQPSESAGKMQDLELYIGGKGGTNEPFFGIERIEYARGQSAVQFSLISPYYVNQNAVQYRYLIDGLTDDWTEWSTSPSITLFPRPGYYTLWVMSRALSGVVSDVEIFNFRIRPRITETAWFYTIMAVAALIGVFALMRIREKKLIQDKLMLEKKVVERTAEIAAQKQEITSSIEYASRIQLAMLSEESLFATTFSDHFVFFRPRDIVSGDFYWIAGEGGRVFFTAADCTGHGVPGAFMSMLGISSLNEIIKSDATLSAAGVLNQLRDRIKQSLKQTGREGETADGIDMALCIFDISSNTIEFAAAYNSMVHFRGPRIKEYRGDRMPIGIFYGEKKQFTNIEIKLNKGDTFYLFTDGFADQFGGPGKSKYKVKNLKLLLSSINELPMIEQKRILEEEFDRWRGSEEQVDDVTVIGIRV